jgi:ATP-dependent helicase YprA (DUF1998 family)
VIEELVTKYDDVNANILNSKRKSSGNYDHVDTKASDDTDYNPNQPQQQQQQSRHRQGNGTLFFDQIFPAAKRILQSRCCKFGCNSCIFIPTCKVFNVGLNKALALELMEMLMRTASDHA